jgi:hypothetical protein
MPLNRARFLGDLVEEIKDWIMVLVWNLRKIEYRQMGGASFYDNFLQRLAMVNC